MNFRHMAEADLDAVMAAEERIYPFPWTRGNFLDSLRGGHDAWLACEEGALVAYAVTMPVVDETHLLNISVVPERQGCGHGSALLAHLLDVARASGASRMLLEVRASNSGGQRLYVRRGFAEIGRRKGYYPAHDGREDAIVMAREL